MNLCPPGCLCVVHPLCIVWWNMAVCLCPSHLIWCCHTLFRMCMCISTVHLPPQVHSYWVPLLITFCVPTLQWPMLCPTPCPSHLISVGTPCLECVHHESIHEFMLCPSHLTGPTPCLECVLLCMHKFMSTFLSMFVWSTPCMAHSLMSSWVALYGSVCIPVILFLLPHIV